MNSLKKTIALACAASVLGFGVAVAQTAPAAPDAAAPAAGDAAAPAADAPATKPMKPMKSMKMSKKTSHKASTHKKKTM